MISTTTRARLIKSAVAISIAGLILTGCTAKAREPFRDAPRGTENSSPADTVTFPDGFSNVSTKCDHGNRLYVAFHGDSPYGALAVVANDPTCGG